MLKTNAYFINNCGGGEEEDRKEGMKKVEKGRKKSIKQQKKETKPGGMKHFKQTWEIQ